MKVRRCTLSPSVACGIAVLCAAVLITSTASTAFAAGVVGTGTLDSCTDAALDAALAGGGLVTFNCGGSASIQTSADTSTKMITADTTVDGDGLITISAGHSVVVFSVNSGVKFTVENLTIAYGSESDDQPGGISNDGTLIVTNSTFTSSGNSICGISNDGTLIVTSSTFSNHGGCIVNQHGSATVINSTFANNSGGSISNGGTLIVTSSTFSNSASGGIFNEGMLTVTNSTFSGNIGYLGGAISNVSGTLTVTNSTFSANQTFGIDSLQGGGAIANRNGTVSVGNSTFYGNSALVGGQGGGAILNFSDDGVSSGILTVTNCTFSGNSAPGGLGAIANLGGAVTVTNSIFSANTGDNCNGPITNGGHNIDDGTTCGFGTASLSNTDPQLDPAGLQDHGGPTQTIALCTAVDEPAGCTATSPALDAGDLAVCADAPVSSRDQRGFARPGAGHANCSIGAYEAEVTPVACNGDCDASGAVTVNELVVMVAVALGDAGPTTCLRGIASGASVDIALLIEAVNSALNGCPARDLFVAATGNLNGDGSIANPYRRITDAVAQARAQRASDAVGPLQAIAIHVAPGTYVGAFDATQLQAHPQYEVLPIILNVPRLALLGSTVLTRDERGLPTATSPGSESIVAPDTPLVPNRYLILVTRTADGGVGDGVTVDGFVFDGKDSELLPHGADVFIDRVSEFRFTNNLVEHSAFGVMTRLASGTIEGNLLADNVELGSVVSGGSRAHPATVLIRANRATRNAAHGIGCTPGGWIGLVTDPGENSITLLEPLQTTFDRDNPADVENIPDTLNVTLDGNDASDNGRPNTGGGIGIRLAGIWPDFTYTTTDPSQAVTSSLVANVIGNTCDSNGAYGVAIETGDTQRSAPRQFIQSLAANFQGNVFIGNDRAPALFTFTYWLVSTGGSSPIFDKFAEASTFAVTDTDGEFVTFDYDNPVDAPLTGTILNNTLMVNGEEVPHGTSITPASAAFSEGSE
jgi:hypothetical protein